MPSRSGQVKEAGSVHRRGVAVYLAAHGLASRSVAAADPGPGNPTPTALAFETAYATDDLLCTLSDGTRLFISAKRTCGDDAHLRDTLEQWAQLVDELRPDDRLVLATAEPKRIVRHLGPALNRRRNGPHHRLPGQRAEGPRRAACAAGRPATGQAGPHLRCRCGPRSTPPSQETPTTTWRPACSRGRWFRPDPLWPPFHLEAHLHTGPVRPTAVTLRPGSTSSWTAVSRCTPTVTARQRQPSAPGETPWSATGQRWRPTPVKWTSRCSRRTSSLSSSTVSSNSCRSPCPATIATGTRCLSWPWSADERGFSSRACPVRARATR